MSPVSRNRKASKRKKSARRPARVTPLATLEPCGCPACSGEGVDLPGMIDDLLADAADLAGPADPLAAEMAAAAFVAICELAGEPFDDALAEGIIPEIEARATTNALTLLLALGSVADGRAGKAAAAAADRLAGAGVALPGWAAELGEPVTAGDCWRLADPQGTGSTLICTLHRAGRAHAVMVSVDHEHCGAAADIMLLDAVDLPQALETVQATGPGVIKESLDPAELRWLVESALGARAVHDDEDRRLGLIEDEDDMPDYRMLAVLVRARMRALPESGRPKAPHGGGTLAAPGPVPRLLAARERGRPPKGAARTGPAPVYQVKVTLRGTKPPIWRRLEVPADISLVRLHTVIQVAFGWYNSHLHVFETPYGEFGTADADLGHLAEEPVALEQVAPGERSKIGYTYDFGDDWRHDIVVEQVLDPDQAVRYPRCTGGRRAGPPEDCGGVWGYAELVDVLADPAHPEHEDRLDWLGLDSAAGFDPAAFDAATVTRALSGLGRPWKAT